MSDSRTLSARAPHTCACYAGNRDFTLHYRLTGTEPESGLLRYEGPREKRFLHQTGNRAAQRS